MFETQSHVYVNTTSQGAETPRCESTLAEVTHSAHGRSQVSPAQLEDGEGAVACHIPDVVAETLGSCGQNKNRGSFGFLFGCYTDFVVVVSKEFHPAVFTKVKNIRKS